MLNKQGCELLAHLSSAGCNQDPSSLKQLLVYHIPVNKENNAYEEQ